ncbi:MAG: hypothetical protein JO006_01740 [Paucibacter sp.]|nr:hypothetical protein [Roseateles sp.]
MDRISAVAGTVMRTALPAVEVVGAAKDFMSDAVANRIRDEARNKAFELLARSHRSVVYTIVAQNAGLLLSLVPVYYLHSPLPFYVVYALVAGYSAYTVAKAWPLVLRFLRTMSVAESISLEVLEAIKIELTQRDFIERKAVEWVGPDLKTVSDQVARQLKPDIVAAFFNMGLTLVLAFIAFRLFAIPMLEHRALLQCG